MRSSTLRTAIFQAKALAAERKADFRVFRAYNVPNIRPAGDDFSGVTLAVVHPAGGIEWADVAALRMFEQSDSLSQGRLCRRPGAPASLSLNNGR